MADSFEGTIQEFPAIKRKSGQKIILKADFTTQQFYFIKRGDVRISCKLIDVDVQSKEDLDLDLILGTRRKQLKTKNKEIKDDIENCLRAVKKRTKEVSTRIIKEGFLKKKGNAAIEKWARRRVCVLQGYFKYYPANEEKVVQLKPGPECHVDPIGDDKFDITVPGRTYSFQVPDSVRDKTAERDEWVRCLRIASSEAETNTKQRSGSVKVLPNKIEMSPSFSEEQSPQRDSNKTCILKKGCLEKQGNAAIKIWDVRQVTVHPGRFSYSFMDKEDKINIVYLTENEACVIPTDKCGFDIKVPNRTYQVSGNSNKKDEELDSWVQAFKTACTMRRSSSYDGENIRERLPTDRANNNDEKNNMNVSGQQDGTGSEESTSQDRSEDDVRLTLICPPTERLPTFDKPKRVGTRPPTKKPNAKTSNNEETEDPT